ncbi:MULTISPECIES: hypothetical protein [Kitasatospora]|uniref:Uncharacterized protein n=1 Tax=Kitasatospora cystarginea TaxID=58350 RepID=A0ABP5QK10_9ACTN
MSNSYASAPQGLDTGPLPRRSAVGLWLQFTLQWLYKVPWSPIVALDFVFGHGVLWEPFAERTLTPRRLRLERRGTQQEWEAWADRIIQRRAAEAMQTEFQHRRWNASGKYRYKHQETEPNFHIEMRYYRGIGAAGVAVVAARHGWDVDWQRTSPKNFVRLVYRRPLTWSFG